MGVEDMRRPPPPPLRVHDQILAKAWNALGLGGKPPPVFVHTDPRPNIMGSQPWFNRRVFIDPSVIKELRGLPLTQYSPGITGPQARALNILAHEYAHVAQQKMLLPYPRVEGGASI